MVSIHLQKKKLKRRQRNKFNIDGIFVRFTTLRVVADLRQILIWGSEENAVKTLLNPVQNYSSKDRAAFQNICCSSSASCESPALLSSHRKPLALPDLWDCELDSPTTPLLDMGSLPPAVNKSTCTLSVLWLFRCLACAFAQSDSIYFPYMQLDFLQGGFRISHLVAHSQKKE